MPLMSNVGRHRTVSTSAIVFTLVVVASLLWFARNGVRLPLPFRTRSCQGTGWRRAFPNAPKDDIRSFLSVFVEAFAFHARERLKFNPNDNILAIYRARYPHKWLPDALELETLAMAVERKYRVSFTEVWSEHLSLGELFAHVHNPPHHRE